MWDCGGGKKGMGAMIWKGGRDCGEKQLMVARVEEDSKSEIVRVPPGQRDSRDSKDPRVSRDPLLSIIPSRTYSVNQRG